MTDSIIIYFCFIFFHTTGISYILLYYTILYFGPEIKYIIPVICFALFCRI